MNISLACWVTGVSVVKITLEEHENVRAINMQIFAEKQQQTPSQGLERVLGCCYLPRSYRH